MATEDLKFMMGTEGSPDYLIVAKNGNVSLGIKPMIGLLNANHSFASIMVAVRIRVALTDAVGAVVLSDGTSFISAEDGYQKAFPEFVFSKMDKARASTEMGQMVPLSWADVCKSFDIESANVLTILDMVMSKIRPVYKTSEESDYLIWVVSQYNKILGELAKVNEKMVAIMHQHDDKDVMKTTFIKNTTEADALLEQVISPAVKKAKSLGFTIIDGDKLH